ncbi:MAG TPA: energy transducer TonB [Fluviicola sp.]|nr:energy transducer TonB [Fluviicola sp.]
MFRLRLHSFSPFLLLAFLLMVNGSFAQTADSVYLVVDHPAEFPGGSAEMLTWIRNNMTFPDTEEDNIVSSFVASFIVEPDGKLSQIRVIKGGSPEINRIIAGTIKSMPRWKPATLNGVIVRSQYHLPVNICFK